MKRRRTPSKCILFAVYRDPIDGEPFEPIGGLMHSDRGDAVKELREDFQSIVPEAYVAKIEITRCPKT